MTNLIVSPRYSPDAGGIETLLSEVLPALTERGHRFVVAAGTDRDDLRPFEMIDDIPVYRFPFGVAVLNSQPKAILELTRRLQVVEAAHGVSARHVHGFGDVGLWYALRSHLRDPLPLAVSVHGTFEGLGRLTPSALGLLTDAHVVTAVSPQVVDSVTSLAPEVAPRVRVIPNGLRVPTEEPGPCPAHGQLLVVGRLMEQKGFDVAISALARLRATHPDVELVVAGGGDAWGGLKAHAQRVGVASHVRFVGVLRPDEVRKAMSDATIVLVPSRSIEGFSLVALEAAHAGRPVIASGVGGLVETVAHGQTGLIVPPDDPDALARAIVELLDDPHRAAAMGAAGRRRAQALFGFEPCVDAYAEVYDELEGRAVPAVECQPSHREMVHANG